jgi:hypothetical protein
MNKNIIWEEKPSMLLLFPEFIKLVFAGLLVLLVYIISKTNYLDGLLNSHFAFKIVGDIVTGGGKYLFMTTCVIFMFFQFILIGKIIRVQFEKYMLDEECFHFENGVFSVIQDETQLFRMIDFEVEKPFLLRLFGCGNLTIFSNDPSLESGLFTKSFITADGNKGMVLAGISNPEEVKKLLKSQVAKVRENKNIRTSEII